MFVVVGFWRSFALHPAFPFAVCCWFRMDGDRLHFDPLGHLDAETSKLAEPKTPVKKGKVALTTTATTGTGTGTETETETAGRLGRRHTDAAAAKAKKDAGTAEQHSRRRTTMQSVQSFASNLFSLSPKTSPFSSAFSSKKGTPHSALSTRAQRRKQKQQQRHQPRTQHTPRRKQPAIHGVIQLHGAQ